MHRLLFLVLFFLPGFRASSQTLPQGATPRGVVFAFLSETASSSDSIKRAMFRERLTGEMASVDPESFAGLLPNGVRFVIDSIPDIQNIDDDDSLRRAVAYVHVTTETGVEDWSLFCAGDSIWRLEAFKRFPTASQASQIRSSLRTIDTTIAGYGLVRGDLERLLMGDDSLCVLLRRHQKDIRKILEPLRKGSLWKAFSLRDVDFARMEEYRELDDDIDEADKVFFSMDRLAMERLKRSISLQRVERDGRYPDAIFFVAGTIGPGSYGYVHASDPSHLPPVTRREFISLKPAALGWWLYRRIATNGH